MTASSGTYDSSSSRSISLGQVIQLMRDRGLTNIYVKKLAPNDNSKNQPYFGAHLTDLPFIPTGDIEASESTSKKTSDPKRKIKYQASVNLSWIDTEGNVYPAPHAKLIYYPQYPEVRFSGFLRGSKVDASRWMAPEKEGRSEGRWLILGTGTNDQVYAYLATPESQLSQELANKKHIEVSNVFLQLDIDHVSVSSSTREALLQKLLEIHNMGWIDGCKLEGGKPTSYNALNAGGYTLEALLGITPNGIAEPDYLGWEIKQFGVTGFPTKGTKPTTLMTPEPNGGYYVAAGAIEFVRRYGYPDKNGKPDRLNFGGKHIVGEQHSLTSLTMELNGFDRGNSSITNASGAIELIDAKGNVTASWGFPKIMDHWKRKHSQAAYIPALKRSHNGIIQFRYGNDIELGTGTSFEMLLSAMHKGDVFYDPGIKLEKASTDKPKIKRRSQFRINHNNLASLYSSYHFIHIEV